jgi:hypothetical protein
VSAVPASTRARAVAVYNAARLGLFVVCLLLGYAAGLRGALLLAAALLVSGVLSYFLLTRQRVAMGLAVESAIRERRSRLAQRTAAEDAADEARRRAEAERDTSGITTRHE